MFITRRALLIYCGFFLFNYPGIQVQLTMLINTFLLIWSATARSYKNPFNNKLELNTEMFLSIITFHLICFTDFIPDILYRKEMGYSFIFWVSCLVLINMYFVLKEIIRVFRLHFIKRYRLYLLKNRPELFKADQDKR